MLQVLGELFVLQVCGNPVQQLLEVSAFSPMQGPGKQNKTVNAQQFWLILQRSQVEVASLSIL